MWLLHYIISINSLNHAFENVPFPLENLIASSYVNIFLASITIWLILDISFS